jgi:hypothetical protein
LELDDHGQARESWAIGSAMAVVDRAKDQEETLARIELKKSSSMELGGNPKARGMQRLVPGQNLDTVIGLDDWQYTPVQVS